MLLFQTVLLLAASTSSPTTFVIDEPTDLILSGGASLTSAPLYSLRSGNPPARTSASIRTVLNPGATIASLSFAYRYDTGFGPTGVGANFTLRAAGQAVYESPHFTDYSYGQNKSNYSQVRKNSLDWVWGLFPFPLLLSVDEKTAELSICVFGWLVPLNRSSIPTLYCL